MINVFAFAVLAAFVVFLLSYATRRYAISHNWDVIPRVWPGTIYVFVIVLIAWGIPALVAN